VRYLLGIVVGVLVVAWLLLGTFGWALLIAATTLVAGAVLGSSLVLED
jgi:hypothetical protein